MIFATVSSRRFDWKMARMIVRKSTFVEVTRGEYYNEYRLLEKLGAGTYGTVYKVQHLISGGIFALKNIPKAKIKDVTRLMTEINVLKQADLPQILTIHRVFEDEVNINFVTELCEGGELFKQIITRGHLTEFEASQIARQMLLAIRYLHMHNISHRDIKPENLMFATADDLNSLKLIDFGFAKIVTPSVTMKTKVGSPYYVSPDVLKGDYGIECDMWSIGVVLYFMLGGTPPFTGKSQPEICANIIRGQYSFPSPTWDSVSLLAKDLIASLLLIDPASRLTAQQALNHPWVNGQVSDNGLTHILPNLSDFYHCENLQKAASLAIAGFCSEHEIMELKKKFQALDVNHDGTISVGELRAGLENLSDVELECIVKSLDQDLNGVVNYSEFIAAALDRSVYLQEEKLWNAFISFDKDRSGRITASELRDVLGKESIDTIDPKFWVKLLQEADKNGDGEIDFYEFMDMMRNRYSGPANG